MVASVVLVALMIGCSDILSVNGREKKPLADPWRTATPLVGDFPVGRWACFAANINYEIYRRANDRFFFNPRCAYIWITDAIGEDRSLSLLPDFTGWVITHGDPSRTSGSGWFRVTGSDLLYHRTDDFRWAYADGTLTVQHTDHETYSIESVHADWLLITRDSHPTATQYMMVRIGTTLYQEIVAFGECVKANNGRKLFEVVECSPPSI